MKICNVMCVKCTLPFYYKLHFIIIDIFWAWQIQFDQVSEVKSFTSLQIKQFPNFSYTIILKTAAFYLNALHTYIASIKIIRALKDALLAFFLMFKD
jgi:hypothetical protein